jgi:hypothetical protein
MALGSVGKVGVAAGLGAISTIGTDAAITYWAKDKAGEWYYDNASLLGGGVSLLVALGLYKLWGSEEAVACAVTGVGTALALPAHNYVAEAATTSGVRGLRSTWARSAMARAR